MRVRRTVRRRVRVRIRVRVRKLRTERTTPINSDVTHMTSGTIPNATINTLHRKNKTRQAKTRQEKARQELRVGVRARVSVIGMRVRVRIRV